MSARLSGSPPVRMKKRMRHAQGVDLVDQLAALRERQRVGVVLRLGLRPAMAAC